jgi:hypothetical protein
MSVARARLFVAAVLFFGWLIWLGYLAFTKTTPVIVSHSQMMAANRFVVAKVSIDPATGALNKNVTIEEDLRPVGAPLTGTIEVKNLEQAEITGGDKRFRDGGRYLLALTPDAPDSDKLFQLTRSPGRVYRPPGANRVELGRPWAYVWDNDDVRKQFEALVPKR